MKKNNPTTGKISSALESFVKTSDKKQFLSTKNVVIYTRVSSREQAENNTSLTSQKRHCIDFCKKKGYTVKETFGGTFESAKNDERKEFNKLIAYVKKNKAIDGIVVYSYDRFSRSGSNAIFLSNELLKLGIKVIAVTQELDTGTPTGKFQKDIFLLFSNLDNELRKDKAVQGAIENSRQGYWVYTTPFGYTNLHPKQKARNHKYIINKEGELLTLAFKLKAEGMLTNKEIVEELRKRGSKIDYKRFTTLIKNPFYCGFIAHKLIPGEIYRGHHPALVSETVFLAANRAVAGEPRTGIAKKYKVTNLALKTFAKTEPSDFSGESREIGSGGQVGNGRVPLTGYMKKGIYYYKSRGKGNAVNVNADHLNTLFMKELRQFEYDEKLFDQLKEITLHMINERIVDQLQDQVFLKKQIAELNSKIEKLEIRFVEEEIDRDLFEKFKSKYEADKKELEQKLTSYQFNSSNLEETIEKALKIALKLSTVWDCSDYDEKRKLQSLVFPEGILYNKEKDKVRTLRTNSLFAEIPLQVWVLEGNESSHSKKSGSKSTQVGMIGFELEKQAIATYSSEFFKLN